MCFLQRKLDKRDRISENTADRKRTSRETSRIPTRPRHVHGSLPNLRCHRLFESYSVPQEKLSRARMRLRRVPSYQGHALVVLQQFAKSAMGAIFGSGLRRSLIQWGKTSRGNLFSSDSVLFYCLIWFILQFFIINYSGALFFYLFRVSIFFFFLNLELDFLSFMKRNI